jgi:hypothetical protein
MDIAHVDLMPTLGTLSGKDWMAFHQYTSVTSAPSLATFEIRESLFNGLSIPIIANTPSDDQFDNILMMMRLFDMTPWRGINVTALDLPLLPANFFSTPMAATQIRLAIFTDLGFPLAANVPIPDLCTCISVIQGPSFAPPNLNALLHFKLGDPCLCFNATMINDSLILDFDSLPLAPNSPTHSDLSAMLLPLCFHSTALDTRPLTALDSRHRAIDFHFVQLCTHRVLADCFRLPLSPNFCTAEVSHAVLQVLEPLSFLAFGLRDCGALLAFEAPDDFAVSLDATVDRLVALILTDDVVPELPIDMKGWGKNALAPLSGDPIVDVDDWLLRDGGPELEDLEEEDDWEDPDLVAMLAKYGVARRRSFVV